MTHADPDLLDRLERYYDAAPRSAADPVECGPFTLFVSRTSWSYYARPHLNLDREVTAADVRALRALQVECKVPEHIEWVTSTTPSLEGAALDAGMEVHRYPLMVLDHEAPVAKPATGSVRVVAAEDAKLPAVVQAIHQGFGSEEMPADDELESIRQRIRDGLQVVVGAFDHVGLPVGGGSHQPIDDVTELVGIATVPYARRRGIGAAVTAALVADALTRSVDLVFLSANDDAVARTYGRVGFTQVATSSAAEPPPLVPDPSVGGDKG